MLFEIEGLIMTNFRVTRCMAENKHQKVQLIISVEIILIHWLYKIIDWVKLLNLDQENKLLVKIIIIYWILMLMEPRATTCYHFKHTIQNLRILHLQMEKVNQINRDFIVHSLQLKL